MKTMPSLPPGYVAQPYGHVDVDGTCYEFHRVYGQSIATDNEPVGRDQKLVPELSFWLVTPLDEGDRPEMRALSYADYLAAGGTLPYRLFESELRALPELQEIDRWFRRTTRGSELVRHLVPRSPEVA